MSLNDLLIDKKFFFKFLEFALNYIDEKEDFIYKCEIEKEQNIDSYIDGYRIYENEYANSYIYNISKDEAVTSIYRDKISTRLIRDGLGNDVNGVKKNCNISYLTFNDITNIFKDSLIFDYPYLTYVYQVFMQMICKRKESNIVSFDKSYKIICDFNDEDKASIILSLDDIKNNLVNNKTLNINYSQNKDDIRAIKEYLDNFYESKKSINEKNAIKEHVRLRKEPNIILFKDIKSEY